MRTKAGLFDVSHMGEVLVNGRDALPFMQKLVTNDVCGPDWLTGRCSIQLCAMLMVAQSMIY